MATEIQKNNYRSSLYPPVQETKRQLPHTLTTRINLLDQPPTTPLSKYSAYRLDVSIGSSLVTLGTRCFDIAKEILLMKADEFSQWAYQRLKDIPSLHTKTPFEIDYAHDKTFWHAHFYSRIDELSSSPDQKQLKNLQNLVWAGFLSPHQYEEGLDGLSWSSATRDQFRTTLQNCSIVIEKGLREDLILSLSSNTDPKEILDYYRQGNCMKNFENSVDK